MIENPNPNNFYTPEEMENRNNYIPKAKSDLLYLLKDLSDKIKSEEPFPDSNQNLDFIIETSDKIDEILNNWYY